LWSNLVFDFFPVPGQQLVELVCFLACQSFQNILEPFASIEIVYLPVPEQEMHITKKYPKS